MSSLLVEVVRIGDITKHPNADTLSMTTVKGWNCIFKDGQFNPGDLALYVPIDSVLPDALVEERGLEYLKNGARVRTVKLRGVLSQGLLLTLPNGHRFKAGQQVADKFGITKWEPPAPSYQGAPNTAKATRNRPNPNFTRYCDPENIKNYPGVFKDGEEVVITEKIHGCFHYSTRILLEDGSAIEIGKLVNQRLRVNVLTFDERDGRIEARPIVNWFKNGETHHWVSVVIRSTGKGNRPHRVKCTPNHHFLTSEGWKAAVELQPGDRVFKPSINLSYVQEQMILGSLLGDGWLYPNNPEETRNRGFACSHSRDHQDYLDLKAAILGSLLSSRRPLTSGYGTEIEELRSICTPAITDAFDGVYDGQHRGIDSDALDRMTPMALAFWYMDDGSRSSAEGQLDRVMFATNGFTQGEVDVLAQMLYRKFGLTATPYESKGWRLRLDTDSSQRFFLMVSPYILPSMQHKLPDAFKGACWWDGFKGLENQPALFEAEVVTVEHGLPEVYSKHGGRQRYDIEVEGTHTYFADGFLVHNSNFRAGKVRRNWGNGWWAKVKRLLLGWYLGDWEFAVGSRNVHLVGDNPQFYDGNVYHQIAKRYNLAKILPEGATIYGEIYGDKIQDLTYGKENGEIDVVFFDMKRGGRYEPWQGFAIYCLSRNLPLAPILYVGSYSDEMVNLCTSGKSELCKTQIREGCVVKSTSEENDLRIGRKILKSISEAYLLRKDGTEYH